MKTNYSIDFKSEKTFRKMDMEGYSYYIFTLIPSLDVKYSHTPMGMWMDEDIKNFHIRISFLCFTASVTLKITKFQIGW